MEADKTVAADVAVSEITTAFVTAVVTMPVCRYDILDSPNGAPVRHAIIGQPVYHQFTCDTDTGELSNRYAIPSRHVLHARALVHRR